MMSPIIGSGAPVWSATASAGGSSHHERELAFGHGQGLADDGRVPDARGEQQIEDAILSTALSCSKASPKSPG